MLDHVTPVGRTCTRHNRHPPGHRVHDDLQQRSALGGIQSLHLAGETGKHDTIHTLVEREDHQPLHTRFVNAAISQKRRGQNRQNPLEASHHFSPPN